MKNSQLILCGVFGVIVGLFGREIHPLLGLFGAVAGFTIPATFMYASRRGGA